ncbi:hypothetical protein BGZ65_008586 [Modicella reniformis]|uniref:Cytochrome b5 heme-binding domain-containing protein n=1 Tax=Modicella reniformis TaxID=1440133 RepID=A0A9P6LRT5_9FUNG|nr:hypothetical protein BGZ65_008586 [Modicella reniformis]
MEKPKQRKQSKENRPHSGGGDEASSSGKVKGSSAKQPAPKKHSVLQGLLVSVLFFFLSSYLITDTWLWGYKGKYVNWRHWVPRKQIVLTQKELAQYDGSDPAKPIYLAVKAEVFDVSAGRDHYSWGGAYGFFSGKDASRAYSTGCFQTHLTHDLRGLSPSQLDGVDSWASFYRNHPKYFKIGTVILDPIDPSSPIPEDCNKPKANMIKSILALAAVAVAAVSAQGGAPLNHISFTQPVGDGITYIAGTNQTFSWTMACTLPSIMVSATPNATEVDFMDSNDINNAFYVKKVGTIDCTKSVGNLVWTVPSDTKPGVYALQLLLTPNNAYSGRFNVTGPGGSTGGSAAAIVDGGNNDINTNGGNDAKASGTSTSTPSTAASVNVGKAMAAVAAGASAVLALAL